MTIKEKIAALKSDYCRGGNAAPTDIHLTVDEEAELNKLTPSDVGEKLANAILMHGARVELPRLFGMTTHWDAERFMVTRAIA